MAISEKRSLGVWCKWVGAFIFSTLGLVAISKDKLVRAVAAIRTLLDNGLEFSDYRSLMGLLEHVRDAARVPKRYVHALYAPHGATGEGAYGPNAMVKPTYFMRLQFDRWLGLLSHCGGCPITAILRRSDMPSSHPATFVAASDAATDC